MRVRSVVDEALRGSGRMAALLSFLLLAGACAGSGGGESDSEEAVTGEEAVLDWTGCYTLSVEAEDWRLPAAVALDSIPLQGWEAFSRRHERVFQARSFREPESSPRDTPFAFWRPLEGDSVTLGHPGALAGVTLRLGRGDEGPRGTALAFTDAVAPGESGRDSTTVALGEVPCESLGPADGGG